MKILIADDHAVIRTGLKHMLKSQLDPVEFYEAANSVQVMALIETNKFDLIILDISMPGRNGLDMIRHLRGEGLNVPVLVFSFHAEEQFAIRALKDGAFGYLCKDASEEEILKAIKQILEGRKYIPLQLAELVISNLENNQKPHELLSSREFQTMCLLASGKKVSEISAELSVSVATVSTYRARLLEKMQLRSNGDLTHYAIENKLI